MTPTAPPKKRNDYWYNVAQAVKRRRHDEELQRLRKWNEGAAIRGTCARCGRAKDGADPELCEACVWEGEEA